MKEFTERLVVKVSPEMIERLDALARQRFVSRSDVARTGIAKELGMLPFFAEPETTVVLADALALRQPEETASVSTSTSFVSGETTFTSGETPCATPCT